MNWEMTMESTTWTIRYSLTILPILLFLMIIGSSTADTLYVDDDGGAWSDFTSIQDAIDASDDGYSIYVLNGTYLENVVVNRSVSIIGNGTEDTWVKGISGSHMIEITANWVNVTGLNVTGSDFAGVWVGADNVTITNCNLSSNLNGIYIKDSNNTILANSTCSHSDGDAIFLNNSHYSVIDNNTVSNNDKDAIQLTGSDHNLIKFNNCSKNSNTTNDVSGIYLEDSHFNRIIDNTCSYNDMHGISLFNSSGNIIDGNNLTHNDNTGLYLDGSDGNTITNNSISHNDEYGIYLTNSDGNIFMYNEIFGNSNYGAYLDSSSDSNTVIFNNFANNGGASSQAYDATGDNNWTLYGNGNFWDDYMGEDSDGDGQGEVPYIIDGVGGETDPNPYVEPVPTDAPEKVPEGNLLFLLTCLIIFFVVFDRRK